MIQALTAYSVPILSKTFTSRKEAVAWASDDGQRYGAVRLIQKTARGPRTIWRAPVGGSEGTLVAAPVESPPLGGTP